MADNPHGYLSLLPPLSAIALAIVTRRVVLSLFVGVLIGGLLLAHGHPIQALVIVCEGHLWASLTDANNLRVIFFTLLMGGMVGIIGASGGMQGFVYLLAPLARSRRGGQLITWALGLVVFFDDYANTLLLGTSMRPLSDRLKISRAKLAYIVDSTAAPVSGLAVLSTWVAIEIGYIDEGLKGLSFVGETPSGFVLLVASIPYRFYVLWALFLVMLVAVTGRDFGAMLQAEKEAAQRNDGMKKGDDAPQAAGGKWGNALLPIVAMLGTVTLLLYLSGQRKLAADEILNTSWLRTLTEGDSYLALLYGSCIGFVLASGLARWRARLSPGDILAAAGDGMRQMLPALAILWLAWTLSRMTSADYLATNTYLSAIMQNRVPGPFFPTLVFVLASLTAFATGSSWGTMGLIMPLALQTSHQLLSVNGLVTDSDPILLGTVGSVLAGAICGDHCSPISDTTVLSSQASGCDHIVHVTTQLPYAMLVGLVAIIFGTLPAGYGVSPWVALPCGTVALVVVFLLLGRRVAG